MLRLISSMLLALLLWPATGAAEDRVLVGHQQWTNIDVEGDLAIMSLWTGNGYVLAVSQDGGIPQPVVGGPAPQPRPIDADIGTDASGQPTIVLSACDTTGCGLSLLRVDGTGGLQRIPGVTLRAAGNAHPTLSRGQIAWVDGGGFILTRSLSDPPDTGSRSIPRPPRKPKVLELELSGRNLAISTNLYDDELGYCGLNEMRVMDLRTRKSRLVAAQSCGGRGWQHYFGPSFDADALLFASTCRDCARGPYGFIRYDLRTRKYRLADDTNRSIAGGWAYAGEASAYLVRGGEIECQDPQQDCPLVLADGLEFKPIAPPIPKWLRGRR
jgi:hypothetical protein